SQWCMHMDTTHRAVLLNHSATQTVFDIPPIQAATPAALKNESNVLDTPGPRSRNSLLRAMLRTAGRARLVRWLVRRSSPLHRPFGDAGQPRRPAAGRYGPHHA